MKYYILNIIFVLSFITAVLFFNAPVVVAEERSELTSGATVPLCVETNGSVCITNPLKGIKTPQQLIGNVIKALLGVIGSLALVMFVYGGFMWMTSAGEKTQVTKGRDTMLWAVLGLTVVFSSYALVRFVIEKVGG